MCACDIYKEDKHKVWTFLNYDIIRVWFQQFRMIITLYVETARTHTEHIVLMIYKLLLIN